jgi:hypothetical protein
MMKKTTRFVIAVCAIGAVSLAGYALEKSPRSQAALTVHNKEQAPVEVLLHDVASAKSDSVKINLVRMRYARPYYSSKGWLKVGFSDNGQSGWVNEKQLERAWSRQRAQNTRFQTIYMNQELDKHGKPVINIVAFKNGKKLSDKEAKKMYESMRVSTLHQEAELSRMNSRMQRMMHRDFNNSLFDDIWFDSGFRSGDESWPTF